MQAIVKLLGIYGTGEIEIVFSNDAEQIHFKSVLKVYHLQAGKVLLNTECVFILNKSSIFRMEAIRRDSICAVASCESVLGFAGT